ncbi:MAG TPA: hypothetical protein VFZ67_06315 [Nitrososphaera sp.]|jgi:hypothetical protein
MKDNKIVVKAYNATYTYYLKSKEASASNDDNDDDHQHHHERMMLMMMISVKNLTIRFGMNKKNF